MPNQNTSLPKSYTSWDLHEAHDQAGITLTKAKVMLSVIHEEVDNIFKCLDPKYKESIGERIEYLILIATDTITTDIDLNNDLINTYAMELQGAAND